MTDKAKNKKNSEKTQNRKEIWGWCSFDWATSAYPTLIVTFVFPAYFAHAIVQDNVLAQVYWTWTIGIAALCVAIGAPILGRIADRKNALRSMLLLFSYLTICLSALLWFAVPGERYLVLILLVVGLSNIAFEFSGFLYNALIPTILPDRQRGALSGLAWGMGYLGGLSALAISFLFLINPQVPIFGLAKEGAENVRATFLLASIWFLVFSIPFFFMLMRNKTITTPKLPTTNPARAPVKSQRFEIFVQGRLSKTARFLLARMLYSDGINTIFAVGGIFAISAHGFSIQDVLIFGVMINVSAAVGAIAGGLLENYCGALRIVRISILAVLLLGIGLIFLPGKTNFWICALTMGLFFGPLQSSSRVILSRLTPAESAGQAFGWYALSGKATAFLGPLTISIATALLQDNRLGLIPILVFLLAGLLLLPRESSNQKGVASTASMG